MALRAPPCWKSIADRCVGRIVEIHTLWTTEWSCKSHVNKIILVVVFVVRIVWLLLGVLYQWCLRVMRHRILYSNESSPHDKPLGEGYPVIPAKY
ncbi:hypothetical protein K458DRAFT_106387 [Lentithecium fluviatile CBS 122367]|uniref:Uncharacterized protein n=1 Tax=Lentithecium fluviatile CBS 122367 TaxID=1168545 RepID=A0A6G1JJV2_9PLEO|nr:hypothetical protein K458DRAFT_106387 [Lentithecium fluviatile CBS 122367]